MYVINEDKDMIYKVRIDNREIVDRGNTSSYFIIKLDLVCGKDWVDVNDYGGTMGWIPPEYFTETFETLICYFYTESVMDALEENGYTETKLPTIQTPRE